MFTLCGLLPHARLLAAPFVIYGLLFVGAIRQRRNIYMIAFILLFLIFLLLAKGSQEPLGALYLFMLEHVPGFRAFRSPDTKFGFVRCSIHCGNSFCWLAVR